MLWRYQVSIHASFFSIHVYHGNGLWKVQYLIRHALGWWDSSDHNAEELPSPTKLGRQAKNVYIWKRVRIKALNDTKAEGENVQVRGAKVTFKAGIWRHTVVERDEITAWMTFPNFGSNKKSAWFVLITGKVFAPPSLPAPQKGVRPQTRQDSLKESKCSLVLKSKNWNLRWKEAELRLHPLVWAENKDVLLKGGYVRWEGSSGLRTSPTPHSSRGWFMWHVLLCPTRHLGLAAGSPRRPVLSHRSHLSSKHTDRHGNTPCW